MRVNVPLTPVKPMSSNSRTYRIGDVVTLKASIVDVYEESAILTVDIDGKRIELHARWDGITGVKPFDPHAIYRDLT